MEKNQLSTSPSPQNHRKLLWWALGLLVIFALILLEITRRPSELGPVEKYAQQAEDQFNLFVERFHLYERALEAREDSRWPQSLAEHRRALLVDLHQFYSPELLKGLDAFLKSKPPVQELEEAHRNFVEAHRYEQKAIEALKVFVARGNLKDLYQALEHWERSEPRYILAIDKVKSFLQQMR